jgi:hypothetical protein
MSNKKEQELYYVCYEQSCFGQTKWVGDDGQPTLNLKHALKFNEHDAKQFCSNDSDLDAYPCHYIDSLEKGAIIDVNNILVHMSIIRRVCVECEERAAMLESDYCQPCILANL